MACALALGGCSLFYFLFLLQWHLLVCGSDLSHTQGTALPRRRWNVLNQFIQVSEAARRHLGHNGRTCLSILELHLASVQLIPPSNMHAQ
ncbi:hypothetical protein BDP55DRAFT_678388 [Colletotrichum godetiae]|uniref:Secreted protein n=1 Tax=Colletotrichum godetiae TaxID=1209918 RepID=A0AAJ0ADL8_9PEZI|nr:uncharacterized protein BDP55DRAFT_686032 [Colletotrichum godetiae]XP_060424531.1 uncharacterized protein BDP55DRAFT_678388 [Colletotrichum godetiae]KAK1657367.1 hypothetical protein BDP55DRAFT_686032 [Colletotrichum godetiae]KAK1659767.1 hypothetical protein BDP55DRAFT_678388 [Colletotrichum godetiae]